MAEPVPFFRLRLSLQYAQRLSASQVEMPSDDGVDSPSVREWQEARASDRAELRRQIVDAVSASEARIMKAIERQQMDSDEVAKAVDGVQSVLDQQRGARNLLLFVGFSALLNVGVLVLHAWATFVR